ncbi:delta endotoxin [Lysinibacillus sp. AC-3]|uniref:insecticidal delta-endotoxin Cry8Ea1 family protein n=1 Tax=unclassified Lysinibacillus TaxID=2636778 RepID=UPI0009C6E798|nr:MULTISPECIES: insecticidal delta-endotoxin Cry8Ea1 family protein [unclassified Lysinibacillus]SKB86395.1 delta endotoxin [Lysinibacillus sp. AC-3]
MKKKKKLQKVISIAVASAVLASTYLPTVPMVFAETIEKEELKVNQTKFSVQQDHQFDSRGLFDSTLLGVKFGDFISAFNSNAFKPLLTQIHAKNGADASLVFLHGILNTGIALLPPPASLLGSIFDVFLAGNSVQDDIWLQIEKYVAENIDIKINDYHQYLMGAELKGSMTKIKEYQRVLQIYKNSLKAKVEEPGTPVIEAVRDADRDLKKFITIIQTPEKSEDSVYQQLTAPFFVQAANIHLLLLRDIILYGEEWGIDKNQLQGYKDQQKQLIQEYTNYAMKVYNDGLEKRKKEAEQINSTDKYKNTDRWNHINEFVREYTLSVLDFVALFPYTEPSKYSIGTVQKNSRQIYSEIAGKLQPKETTWQDIQKILDSQEYKGVLTKLDIRSGNRIDAIQPWYNKTGIEYTPGWVGNTSGGKLNNITNISSIPLTKIRMGYEITPFFFDITDASGKSYPRYGTTLSAPPKYTDSTFEFPDQKVSLVHAFNKSTQAGFEGIDAVVFGYSNKNLSNTHDLMANMISSIPAEMYNKGKNNFTPQVESIHAQQKAMKTETVNSYLAYDVVSPKEQEYKIRYKIAVNQNAKIRLSNNSTTQETSIPITGHAGDTIKGEYGYYKTVDGPTVKLKKGSNELKLENLQGKFSLASIELEPVTKDKVVAQDNFDNQRSLIWNPPTMSNPVDGGMTGKAGLVRNNSHHYIRPINSLPLPANVCLPPSVPPAKVLNPGMPPACPHIETPFGSLVS